ncbi:MAG: hypothetical protein EPN30_06590 [Actinomycetota bacterium]|nr:MAG: hypothetical protein EPN30_06590 [Actinomycetota bacterium]
MKFRRREEPESGLGIDYISNPAYTIYRHARDACKAVHQNVSSKSTAVFNAKTGAIRLSGGADV